MNQPQAVVYRGDFFSSLVGERVQRTVIPFAVLRPAFTFYHRLPMILFTAYALSMATLGVTVETDGFDSRAVAAAVQRAGPGDTIRFAAGIYRLDEPIRPKSKTRLIGAGQEKTLVVYRGTRNAVFVELAGCEDLELAGMTLDGENSRHLNQGISGTNSRRLWLHHLTIRNLADVKTWGPHAILFSGHNPTAKQGVTDSRITDCRIENIGVGAEYGGGIRLAWGSDRNEVAGNTIYKTGRGGIFGDHSVELRIHGNRVSGSGGEGLGIEIWGGCLRSLIEDNLIDHWLSVDQGTQSAVRRNVIGADDGSLKGFGIEIIARDVVVTDNVVNQGAHIGLSVSNVPVKNNVFWGYNTFRDCAQWGAQLQGESGGIARHYFYRCAFEGTVRGDPRAMYPNDSGNGFRTNGECRDLVFEECSIAKNGGCGVQLGGPNVDRLSFLRSAITGNAQAAVTRPDRYTALEFKDCTVRDNGNNRLPESKAFPHAPPAADFRFPEIVRAGEAAQFRCDSRAAMGEIAERLWDFGHGIPALTAAPEHTFERPGKYRVTLIVWARPAAADAPNVGSNVLPASAGR